MQSARKSVLPLVIGAFLVVLAGVVTAWMLSANVFGGSGNSGKGAPGVKVTSTEAGKLDPDVKYDAATGVLTEGGIMARELTVSHETVEVPQRMWL